MCGCVRNPVFHRLVPHEPRGQVGTALFGMRNGGGAEWFKGSKVRTSPPPLLLLLPRTLLPNRPVPRRRPHRRGPGPHPPGLRRPPRRPSGSKFVGETSYEESPTRNLIMLISPFLRKHVKGVVFFFAVPKLRKNFFHFFKDLSNCPTWK